MKNILFVFLLLFCFRNINFAKNYAIDIPNSDGYVDCGSMINSEITSAQKVTLEAWIKIKSGGSAWPVVAGTFYSDSWMDGGFALYLNSNQIYFCIGDYSTAAQNYYPADDNNWHHIAGTWDQTTGEIKVYVDGNLGSTISYFGNIGDINLSTFYIGYALGGYNYSGSIDEVRVWKTVRSEAQIQDNMNSELVGNESGLVAYYRMNEGSGSVLTDNSTNGNTGNLINEVNWITPTNPLPVELTSFTATENKGKVVLNWATATEINNYGFEIERSLVTGHQSLANWEKIGFVEGHGSSNSPKVYSFTDDNPVSGNLQYRLKQIDADGAFEYYSTLAEVNYNLTGVNEKQLPAEFSLDQNFPNPFNPSTLIKYALPQSSHVTLEVYSMLGEKITTLLNKNLSAGYHEVRFDGNNLNSGIYIYRLTGTSLENGKQFTKSAKMMLIK